MRKILTAGLAALTLGGSVAMTATPAAAQRGGHGGGGWHGGGGGWHGGGGFRGGGFRGEGFRGGWRGDDDWGWGLGAGLAGFALGTALADRPYYGDDYYGPGYYDYGYAECVGRERIWDPYIGRYVIRRFYYAC